MAELNPAALPEGSLFQGRYQIVRCIKAGGMGAVYEVIHLETRRRRALKVMLPSMVADPDLRARFKLEATVAADIESEHIVETFDAGVDPDTGAPFLVMELLRGEDLLSLLKKRGRLSPEETVTLLFQAALALDKTHAAGVVHRDLKPENLFVTYRDDGSPRLKVLDFGIAKVVAQSTLVAQATRSMGTPVYMSPEQIRGDGKIGPRADVYALGHIAYALLTGEPYWKEEAQTLESVYPLLLRVAHGVVEPATLRAQRRFGVSLSASFDGWFARAVAVREGERFGQASAMVAGLAEAVGVALPRMSASGAQPLVMAEATAPLPEVDTAAPWQPTPGTMATPAGSPTPGGHPTPGHPTPGSGPQGTALLSGGFGLAGGASGDLATRPVGVEEARGRGGSARLLLIGAVAVAVAVAVLVAGSLVGLRFLRGGGTTQAAVIGSAEAPASSEGMPNGAAAFVPPPVASASAAEAAPLIPKEASSAAVAATAAAKAVTAPAGAVVPAPVGSHRAPSTKAGKAGKAYDPLNNL